MLKSEHEALLASLGPRPKRRKGVHDWAPALAYAYCRKCGTTRMERRAKLECDR